MKKRIGITGIGVVSPLGLTVQENWKRICRNESAIEDCHFAGYEAFPHCRCGAIKNFDPTQHIANRRLLKLMNRESQLAFVAADQALKDSGIAHNYTPDRIGLYLGTGLTSGDMENLIPIVENAIDEDGQFSYSLLGTKALAKCNPLLSFKILPNMALSYISIEQNIQGPNMVFNPWSGNTAQAIMEAKRAIEYGEIDCALVGGCDSKCNYIGFLTFSQMGLLSHKGVISPFSSESDGLVLGEGSAFLVLESLENASKRSGHIYAELCGGVSGSDPFSEQIYSYNTFILEEVMSQTFSDAEIQKEEIDAVCVSANSNPIGDGIELDVLKDNFQNHDPMMISLNPYTGDLIAASSIYALVLCAYSFHQKEILPSLNTIEYGNKNQSLKITTILVNSFSIGSTKASMIVRKYLSN